MHILKYHMHKGIEIKWRMNAVLNMIVTLFRGISLFSIFIGIFCHHPFYIIVVKCKGKWSSSSYNLGLYVGCCPVNSVISPHRL